MPLHQSEIEQKNIFEALVRTQDNGTSVTESRVQVAEAYALTVEDVIQIERNGIAAKWPPLDGTSLSPE